MATPSLFDQEPTICVLEVELGTVVVTGGDEVLLGDQPVDRCGMVLGDATALDAWTGPDAASRDGLADVIYWGRDTQAARDTFGGQPIGHGRVRMARPADRRSRADRLRGHHLDR